jgi:hypothetical protein
LPTDHLPSGPACDFFGIGDRAAGNVRPRHGRGSSPNLPAPKGAGRMGPKGRYGPESPEAGRRGARLKARLGHAYLSKSPTITLAALVRT